MYDQKKLREKKFIWITHLDHRPLLGKLGTQVGVEAGTTEESFLMACSQVHPCSATFLIFPRPTRPEVTLPTVGLASHINQQSRKCHRDMPIGQSDGGT